MQIDPAALCALISDLTTRVTVLENENAQLRQAMAEKTAAPPA